MTHPTDEELDALVKLTEEFVTATWHLLDNSETSGPKDDPTITVWQPNFDEVSALLDRCEGLPSGSMEHMAAGELLAANLISAITTLRTQLADANASAERAEAATAAQIEADARIVEALYRNALGESDADLESPWKSHKASAFGIAVGAIRAQPHDRTALDRMLAAANAGCCQPVKVKPLVWTDFANVIASPNDLKHGDNLAVALCSYFDRHENCPGDDEEGAELDDYDCWKIWVSENTEKVLRRIAKAANDHILATLEPAPRVSETPKSEHDSTDVLAVLPDPVTLAEALKVPEVQALVKALRTLLIAADGESYADYFGAIETATAALRAIEEGEV